MLQQFDLSHDEIEQLLVTPKSIKCEVGRK